MLKLRANTRERQADVIPLTRSNGAKFYLNPELIQTVETTPDTVITLTNNKKIIVRDKAEEVAERFVEYRRKTLQPLAPFHQSPLTTG
jgi:flagellar protein FlbD